MEVGEGQKEREESSYLHFLKAQVEGVGGSQEFSQFERSFYAQREELAVLRQNVDYLRSSVTKLQEEKRALELKLLSEKAQKEEEARIAATRMEKGVMALNTEIYSMKCDAEMWKRKAEAAAKESEWLKEQLKTLELDKTQALRKVEELARQNGGLEQFRASVETYMRKAKENMGEVQKQISVLEKSKESFCLVLDRSQKQMKLLAVLLKNREKIKDGLECRIQDLGNELVKVKSELAQNDAEMERLKERQKKTVHLVNKLVVENKDLHDGFKAVMFTMNEELGQNETGVFERISQFHEEIMQDITSLAVDDSDELDSD